MILDTYQNFVERYPVRYIFKRASAHWNFGFRNALHRKSIRYYHCTITEDLAITYSYLHPLIPLRNNYLKNFGNFSVAVAGMSGVCGPVWERHMFDTDFHENMISYDQFDTLCQVLAVASHRFYIPIYDIMVLEEWAKQPNRKYPRGYFPEKWDLMGLGPEMRDKIKKYCKEIVREFGHGRYDEIFGGVVV